MSDLGTVVRNELLFREVNERIFQISSRQGEGLERYVRELRAAVDDLAASPAG